MFSSKKFITCLLHPIHPSWCLYTAVCGVIAGIILGVIFGYAYFTEWFWWIVALLLIIISLRHSCLFLASLAAIGGLLLGNFRVHSQFSGQEILSAYLGRTVILAGNLSEDASESHGALTLRLQNLRLFTSTSSPDSLDSLRRNSPSLQTLVTSDYFTDIAGTFYVTVSSSASLERSDLVLLRGKLEPGFGTFSGKLYRAQLITYERQVPGDLFAQFKHWFSQRVHEFLPSPQADLGLGYLMGLKSGLPEDFSTALQMVGMTHVVVASGAHLAIITSAAKKIFGKISRFAGLFFSLLMILAFALVVGFTPSMTRASLVAGLSLLAGYVGRRFTPLRLILFVAMVTLLLNPIHLLNLGWQLSFASFFGILILAPRLTKTFYGRKTPPWLASMLITSISTTLICSPIMIYNFGLVSLLSLVANLIILPTLPYAMLATLLVGSFGFLPPLASLLAYPTVWLLDLHIWLVNFLSEKTMFILNFPTTNFLVYLIYLPILCYLIYPTFRRIRKKSPSQFAISTVSNN